MEVGPRWIALTLKAAGKLRLAELCYETKDLLWPGAKVFAKWKKDESKLEHLVHGMCDTRRSLNDLLFVRVSCPRVSQKMYGQRTW